MWIKSGARLKLARNCSQLIDVGSNCAGANASASPSALARAAAPTRCPVRTRKSLRYTTPPRTRVVILQPGRSLVREGETLAMEDGRPLPYIVSVTPVLLPARDATLIA